MFGKGNEASANVEQSHASVPQYSDGDSSSMFERANEFGAGRKESSDVDFDLTKTGKSLKQVSFAKQGLKKGKKDGGKLINRQNLAQAADDFKNDEVNGMLAKLEHMRVRTQEVEDKVGSGFCVEDSKLLEAIMEHILVHWDDIMAVLIDELIEEEVLELNRLEDVKRTKE